MFTIGFFMTTNTLVFHALNSDLSQVSAKQSQEFVYELPDPTPPTLVPANTRRFRAALNFSKRHPRLSRRLTALIVYVRGPRPNLELPAPVPIFNVDVHVAGKHIVVPVESQIVKSTRFLTSPGLFIVLVAAYIIAFAFLTRSHFLTREGAYIDCLHTYWLANGQCGLNGQDCPYDSPTFEFRCPAKCDLTELQNPRTVGNQEATFVPLIVGGGDSNQTFRGDSFVCPAAIQAGIVSRHKGGCGTVQLVFNHTDYIPFTSNGLSSLGFPTIFPIGFRLSKATSLTHCTDLRDAALAFNVLVTCALFLLLRPKPIVLFWCLTCIGFWHVALFDRPRGTPPRLDLAFGTFLPTLFIAYGFWRMAFRYVLPVFRDQPLESCLIYLSGYWVGVLHSLTLERLPLSRLVVSDVKKRSGAVLTVVIGAIVVLALITNQVRVIRKTGWLPYYLGWYTVGGLVLLVLGLLPGLALRLHHYIFAIMLVPITAFPTRFSAFIQGFVLGLFISGAAAYGFDSILERPVDLLQDAARGSPMPTWLTNSMTYNKTIPLVNQTIEWGPLSAGWDSFSLLVDDVERYIGRGTNYSLAGLNATIPHFFRLAYRLHRETGDFTKTATLWPNGTWVDPLPGASY